MGKRKQQSKAFQRKVDKKRKDVGDATQKKRSKSMFEMKSNKRAKRTVFGRKISGQNRNVIAARAAAIDGRKRSLLKEYKAHKKANTFIDRRLGENAEGLDEEDKMLLRMQRQRERQFRKHRFNLDEGEAEELTHFGQSLGASDFNSGGRMSDDDSDDNGDIGEELVDKTHFGGGFELKKRDDGNEKERDRPKTRREIMQEIIRKSKIRKAEKAREKDAREGEREELDAELEGIHGLLEFGKKEKKTKKRKDATLGKNDADNGEKDEDEYDRMIKELAHEHRAQATDRMRTPAEIARMERARLEHLEEQRVHRMRADAQDDDSGAEYSYDESVGNETGDSKARISKREREVRRLEERKKRRELEKRVGGDDLDSNFIVDPEFAVASSSEEDEEDEEDEEAPGKRTDASLPFIVETCPKNHSELESLLRKWSALPASSDAGDAKLKLSEERRRKRADLLLERVRLSHSALVDEANAPKLRLLFRATLDMLCAHCGDRTHSFAPWLVTTLARSAWKCAQEIDVDDDMRDRVVAMQARYASGASNMPSVAFLIVLRMIGSVYSSSDYRHPIVTPTMLLMGQLLTQSVAVSAVDVLSGLCIVETMLQFTRQSKRFMPECVAFLSALISRFALAASASSIADADESDTKLVRSALLGAPKCCPSDATLLVRLTDGVETDVITPSRIDSDLENGAFGLLCAELRTQRDAKTPLPPATICAVLRLMRRLASAHASKGYFRAAFESPIASLRLLSSAPSLPSAIDIVISDTLRYFTNTADRVEASRGNLRMKIHRPVAIRQMIPRFDEDFDPSRKTDPDRARAALKQMKRNLKRERKNTTRELRRDNAFLAREREKEIEARDARLEARQKDVMKFLEEQQRTFKQMVKQGNIHGGGSGGGGQKTKKRQFG